MRHVFISFSNKDARFMATMRENLIRIGYKPWIDPSPRPNQDWRFAIDDAIRSADAVVVIVTPAAAESVYVTYEWSLALGAGVPVIPVVFKQARMHPRLQTLEHYDFTGFRDQTQFWDHFMREMRRYAEIAPAPSSPAPVAPPMPPIPPTEAPMSQAPAYTRSVMPQEPGYYLVIRRGPQLNAIYRLNQELVTLGRDSSNVISIEDSEVSRFHLRLTWQGDGYAIEDLGSTNGTRINGGARTQGTIRLEGGMALMLGDSIILSYEVVS